MRKTKLSLFVGLIIGLTGTGLQAINIDTNDKIVDSIERIHNGKTYTYVKYMDKHGDVYDQVLDKNNRVVNKRMLKSENLGIFRGKLKAILDIKPGDEGYLEDTEVLDLVISLKVPSFEIDKDPTSTDIEIGEDGFENIIKYNGQKITINQLKELDLKERIEHDKAFEHYNTKIKDFFTMFSKMSKFGLNEEVIKALNSASSSIHLKMKKNELQMFSMLNSKFIAGIELYEPSDDSLSGAMLSTNIDPYALNYSGRGGQDIGIYMSESGCPNTTHISNYMRLSGSRSDHSENVTGILRGVSPESYIYCRSGYTLPTSNDISGYNGNPRIYIQTHSHGSSITNRSYTSRDKDFDNHVYNRDISVFAAAGNRKTYDGTIYYNVTSPGRALNIITVGNYNDSTENISSTSCYTDSNTNSEKPELVAPGQNIRAGGHTMSGTSMATPHAAAFAADLMSKYTWLQLRPSWVKGLMLSGATNDIDGGVEKVGVGGIDFYRSYYNGKLILWRGNNNSFSYFDSKDNYPNNGRIDWDVQLSSGKKTRVVITWLNRGSYVYDNQKIGMDIDLYVYDPDGNRVGYSGSISNPYEKIDFVPTKSGKYRVSIKRYKNSDISSDLDLAAVVNWQ